MGIALRTDMYAIDRDAVRDGKVVVVDDRHDPRMHDVDRAVYDEYGFESEVIIPLLVQDRVVGLIELYGDRPRMFAGTLEYARSAGHIVAGALEKALLLEALEDRARVLRELFDLAQLLSRTYDVEQLLRTVATRLLQAVQAAHCDIYQIDGDGYRCVVSAGADGFLESYEGSVLDLSGNPTSARALAEHRALVVADVEASELTAKERDALLAQDLHSELCIPLVVKDAAVGLIDLFGARPRDWQECIEFAAGVGQLVAGAMENADLLGRLEGRNRDLRTLVEGGLEFGSTLDVERVLLSIARRMRGATSAAACDIYALDGESLRALVAVDGKDAVEQGFAGQEFAVADYPLTGQALRTGRPVAVEDIVTDVRASPLEQQRWAQYGFRSGVIVPLINGAQIVGATALYGSEPRSFGQLDLLRGLSQVAGQAIVNARLYGELERRNREAELLNEIARRTTASLDLGEIAEATVTGLSHLVPIASYSLTLEEHGEFTQVHGSQPSERPRAVSVTGDALGDVLERLQRERVVILDGADDGLVPGGRPAVAGSLSSAAIGLFDQHILIGVLMLEGASPRAFSAVDAGVLERVGVHLSLAANNARLYQEIKTLHLSNLKGLSTALNAKDYYTLGHAARVAAYTVLLGEELGWEPEWTEQVREAAYLHDIGKIGVSDRVLVKQGPLNAEEWELMRQHPAVSAEIIKPLFSAGFVAAVRHHHERYDGKGYPDGLGGEEIPELARAMCVVDSYDAMSLQRPYRAARTYDGCLAELQRCRGTQFDPGMTDAFLRVLTRLAALREVAERAAAEAALRIDPVRHAALRAPGDEASAEYAKVRDVLREVRDAYPEVRFMTTEARLDGRYVIVVDAEETDAPDRSPLGEDVMADDAITQVLSGRPIVSNVLFVDTFGVWVNGLAPLVGKDGEILAAVVADAPALSSSGARGFARMTTETPVSTLQEAAVRLSRAEIEAITDGLTGLYNHRYCTSA